MALTSTYDGESVFGNFRVTHGTFTQEQNDVGGDIDTGLSTVLFFTATGAQSQTTVGGTVSIVNDSLIADMSGHWLAFGY
jgi:phage-related minor tail protein